MAHRRLAGLAAALAIIVSTLPAGAAGTRLYVSAGTGDDQADGRSPETAFATLPRAVGALGGGDTLVVMPGVYHVAPLVIQDLPSTPENPIRILAEPRGMATLSAAWPQAATGRVQWQPEGDGIHSAPALVIRP